MIAEAGCTMSSSAIRSGAACMARAMRWCRPRRRRRSAPGWCQSSVWETRAEREAGQAFVGGPEAGGRIGARRCQRARHRVAYEPVWAIGTGLTPTAADVGEVHAMCARCFITGRPAGRRCADSLWRSVKPSNARELMGVAHVDGALVGGASLKADDFLGIASPTSRPEAVRSPSAAAARFARCNPDRRVDFRDGDRHIGRNLQRTVGADCRQAVRPKPAPGTTSRASASGPVWRTWSDTRPGTPRGRWLSR